jgi:deoxyribodipyrimidine photo-lyase
MDQEPIIVWFRNDLRLADNPALRHAANSGRPVIPLYILDQTPGARPMGAASLWWLERSLKNLGEALKRLAINSSSAEASRRKCWTM